MTNKLLQKPDDPLPTTPSQMPLMDYKQQCEWLRSVLVDLQNCDAVEITYQQTDDECDCDDGPQGTWSVEICNGAERFVGEYGELQNALWFAYVHAKADDREDYQRWQREREAALAKLSESEKRLLGVG